MEKTNEGLIRAVDIKLMEPLLVPVWASLEGEAVTLDLLLFCPFCPIRVAACCGVKILLGTPASTVGRIDFFDRFITSTMLFFQTWLFSLPFLCVLFPGLDASFISNLVLKATICL